MAGEGEAVAVLFADVSGSTKLYEVLGDAQAKTLIDEVVAVMRTVTLRQKGRVVKTIGDEVMCVFPDADHGHYAATDMQTKVSALPEVGGVKRAIRVGFNAGPVIPEGNDVFGDTVNTAARMAGLARGGQIITTLPTVMLCAPLLRESTRRIAALAVKGKGEDVEVCEVIWNTGGDLTMMTGSGGDAVVEAAPAELRVTHGGRELVLDQGGSELLLGRDKTCQIVIADPKASRVHAKIERRRDRFYLIDQSTNGTFVTFAGEKEIGLRREEVMLRGQGSIVFGHTQAESAVEVVRFSVSS